MIDTVINILNDANNASIWFGAGFIFCFLFLLIAGAREDSKKMMAILILICPILVIIPFGASFFNFVVTKIAEYEDQE